MTAHHERFADPRLAGLPRIDERELGGRRLSSAEDYQREAEMTRRRLAGNLEELSDRLTPGQVFDEMLTYSRVGGGAFMRAFTDAMRRNPLPSLLIGTGCMMFLSDKMGVGSSSQGDGRRVMATGGEPEPYRGVSSPVAGAARRFSDTGGEAAGLAAASVRSAADSVRSGVDSIRSSVSGAAQSARRQTSDAAAALADTAHETAASVRDTAASMSDAVVGAASSIGETLADTTSRSRRQAAEVVRQGRDSAASFVTEQPLLCAAIGLAIGAALASLIPRTDAEDKLMGDASDAVKDRASQVGSDAMQSANNVAGKAAERARAAVKEEDLSPAAAAEATRSLADAIPEGAYNAMNEAMTGAGPQEGVSRPDGR